MRLWFAPNNEVPVYRQLATQVSLAILAGELKPGDRLPSVRDLARRYSLHANTISAGYRHLEKEGWTEHRHGSGVFVRKKRTATTPEELLDFHITEFLRTARACNLSSAFVRERIERWLALPRPDHFLLVEPDPGMRAVLLAELRALTTFEVVATDLEKCRQPELLRASLPVCRPSKTAMVRDIIPSGYEIFTLPIRSAREWLATWLPTPDPQLIGIVSHWQEFLTIGQTMLVSTGVAPESLEFRDARKNGWAYGMDRMSTIVCDVLTAASKTMPVGPVVRPYKILADSAESELATYTTYYSGTPSL